MKKQFLLGISVIIAVVLAACSGLAVETVDEVLPPAEEEAVSEQAVSEEAVEEEVMVEEETQPEAAAGTVFNILAEESEARFIASEVLNGAPKMVVGVTSNVEGTVTANYANASSAGVDLTVDLSTLTTDNNFRNGAIRDRILQTQQEDFRYAQFTSTRISGLPDTITVGETYTFQLTGDLTIHGVTRSETFDVTATAVSDMRIEGTATLSDIAYADYGVAILRLPEQVASVADIVTLEIDFAAEAG